jgi:hypothetical protein
LRKSAGRVAVDIARELVQHQDLGQAPLGRGAPGKQFTPRRRLQRGTEAGADGFVQGSVFGEVVLWGEFGEPELEDVSWCHLLILLMHYFNLLRYFELHFVVDYQNIANCKHAEPTTTATNFWGGVDSTLGIDIKYVSSVF